MLRLPARSHVTWLFWPSLQTMTQNPNPHPSPESRRCPELNHNPYPSPNPNPNGKLRFVHQFAAHWARDLHKSSSSPITHQGCILTLRHVGWFEISVGSPNMSAPPSRCWVGNAASFCLCCRPTHSPSGSPIRTTSSIRCGAGTVGYWTDCRIGLEIVIVLPFSS